LLWLRLRDSASSSVKPSAALPAVSSINTSLRRCSSSSRFPLMAICLPSTFLLMFSCSLICGTTATCPSGHASGAMYGTHLSCSALVDTSSSVAPALTDALAPQLVVPAAAGCGLPLHPSPASAPHTTVSGSPCVCFSNLVRAAPALNKAMVGNSNMAARLPYRIRHTAMKACRCSFGSRRVHFIVFCTCIFTSPAVLRSWR
jgi:hypothetical protein